MMPLHLPPLRLPPLQNPTGKVFTREELEAIGSVIKKHSRVVLVTDEVRVSNDRAASSMNMWPCKQQ
jgi:bifunctional pyridoxal-dependent enzyme with beta-cystathionase and maltose regulon repressor activities